jgi:hypothetical protein
VPIVICHELIKQWQDFGKRLVDENLEDRLHDHDVIKPVKGQCNVSKKTLVSAKSGICLNLTLGNHAYAPEIDA